MTLKVIQLKNGRIKLVKSIYLLKVLEQLIINLNKCFSNTAKALYEYEKENIRIHNYIWIYLETSIKNKKHIRIKRGKIKKLSFIV